LRQAAHRATAGLAGLSFWDRYRKTGRPYFSIAQSSFVQTTGIHISIPADDGQRKFILDKVLLELTNWEEWLS